MTVNVFIHVFFIGKPFTYELNMNIIHVYLLNSFVHRILGITSLNVMVLHLLDGYLSWGSFGSSLSFSLTDGCNHISSH